MQFADNRHATEDDLERYSMGRMAEPELADFEEHLLICAHCQDRLTLEDHVRQGTRDAATVLQAPSKAAARGTLPRLAWGFGFAILGLVALIGFEWQPLRRVIEGRPLGPSVILLQATRGSENPPSTPAGRAIVLVLDIADLPQFPKYKLEVVDSTGHAVFQADAVPQNNKVQAPLVRGLPGGVYFIRVYTTARELLREYALTVQG